MQLHSQRRADCCYNCSHVVLVALTGLARIIASRSPSDTAVSCFMVQRGNVVSSVNLETVLSAQQLPTDI